MTLGGLALTLMGTLAVYGFWRHRVTLAGQAQVTVSS
jgi:hypothetical protein